MILNFMVPIPASRTFIVVVHKSLSVVMIYLTCEFKYKAHNDEACNEIKKKNIELKINMEYVTCISLTFSYKK